MPRSDAIRVGDVALAPGDDAQTQREKLARVVLDSMYQFVGLLDADGMTLEINRAALQGAGLRIDDIRGRPFWEARWFQVSPEVSQAQRDYVRRARAGEFIRCDTEVYGRAAGEETIVVDFSLLPVRDEHGRVVFLLAEGRDITEKKRVEAEVARKNAELQCLLDRIRQLDQLKSDLFANVSHELRTPLALILGPAEELLADTRLGAHLDAHQHESLRVIQRNAATLLRHVNDLLDLAKRDAHQLSLSPARVDLAALVRNVAEQFHAAATPRSLSYAVVAPPRLAAEVDANKVERVLMNLLSNAFKFTPPGGRIRCELRALSRARALLSVQDTGPGIEPALRNAVFERFRQVQSGTTREFGGTGLGLAIAKEFVDLHGGTIVVTEAPGGGALFQVELPLRARAGSVVVDTVARTEDAFGATTDRNLQGALAELVGMGDATPIPSATGASSSRVLVVEDNPQMRRFIAQALAAEHQVQAVADGELALACARRSPPDLVVTDLMMPRLGGDRMVQAMRSDPLLADVPVLVLSAKDDQALRSQLLDNRVQDYVTKPFSAPELRARARNLTTMKRARDGLRRELAQVARASTLGELVASIAHEVNQPLAAIVTNGQACMRWMSAEASVDPEVRDAEARSAVQRIVRDAHRASEVIGRVRRLLDRGEPQREPVHPRALTDEVIDLVRPQALADGVALRCDSVADLPEVEADRVQVQQIVLNLLMNAIEAVGARAAGDRTVHVSLHAVDDEAVRFDVRDNGAGIAPQNLDRVFDAFHTTKPGGMGMGLAISRSIVEAHGGRLWVTPNDGPGVTFSFTLPLRAA